MIRNYLIIALRNILRQKGYTLINVSGLAIGIISCLLILFYIFDEVSYDRFHIKSDRVHRLLIDYTSPNGEVFSHVIGPYRLAPELKQRYPDIEQVCRISYPFPTPIRLGDIEFMEDNVMLTDENIFQVYTFDMLYGDTATALKEPFTYNAIWIYVFNCLCQPGLPWDIIGKLPFFINCI